ncbi:uncharacterized protein LOC144437931 [Glandiceps talaboti]
MSGYGYQQPSMSRTQEKSELQHLNNRFSDYIKKVEDARNQANQVDSSALLNAIKNLEKESAEIKRLYEDEIGKLRRELDAASADRQRFEAAAQKNAQLAADLQNRLVAEQRHNRELQDELARLRQQVGAKDVQLGQALADNKDLAQNLDKLKNENDALKRNLQDVSGKYDKDSRAQADAREALANLQKKSDFDRQVYAKELAELKSRLDDKDKQILQLEARLRDSTNNENKLPEMLERVRSAANAELQKYKAESEAEYAKNLNDLKKQLGQDAADISKLADENKKLTAALEDARRDNAALLNKIRALEDNNAKLAQSLDQERQKSSAHIRALEDKLKDLQNQLIAKLRDQGSGKEPPIAGEIESLKVLVEDAESKLVKSPPGSRDKAGWGTLSGQPAYSTGYGTGTGGVGGRGNTPVGQYGRNMALARSLPSTGSSKDSVSFPHISEKTTYRVSYGHPAH